MKRHEKQRINSKKQKDNTSPIGTSTPIQEFSLKKAILQLTGCQLKKNELENIYEIIKRAADSERLPPRAIEKVVEAVGSEQISVRMRAKFIDCLLPKSSVPEHAVIVATCYLTSMKFNFMLKVKLLKWMVDNYKKIDSTDAFVNLYGMLFLLLESEDMRFYLCLLLAHMTKKEHVLIHRIKYLVDLQSRVGPQPPILILMEIYDHYRPDIVIVHCRNKNVYRKFGALPFQIKKTSQPQQQERHTEISMSSSSIGLSFTKEVRTYKHLQESLVCLQDCRGIQKLLQTGLRRILITSNYETSVPLRLSLFIRDALYVETLHLPNLKHSPRKSLLPILSEVAFELQEGITEVSSFIKRYINLWDGETYSKLVFEAIPYFKLCPYEVLYEELLQPLFPHFVASSISYKCRVIQCLSALYQNWILFEIERSNKANRQLLNFEKNSISDPYKEIYALACHLDRLCVIALNLHPDHPPLLLYEVLEIWDMITLAHSKSQCGNLPLPSKTIICASAFSSNTNILIQMCKLILRYKEEIGKLKGNNTMNFMHLDILNKYISHTCEMLKSFESFDSLPDNSFFSCELPSEIRKLVVEPMHSFNICNHPSLLLCFKKFMDLTGEDLLSVDLNVIADDYLNYVSLSGFGAIADFLKSFIKEYNED